MSQTKFLNTSLGQRIDRPDFDFQASEGPIKHVSEYAAQQVLGYTSTVGGVLRGFTVSSDGGTQLTVTRGSDGAAILGVLIDGVAVPGFLVAGGAESRLIDVSGLSNLPLGDTYTVWIRGILTTSDFENRFQWNATAPTPVEIVSNVPTRLAADWETVVSQSNPGPEWTAIADFQKTSGLIAILRNRQPYIYGPGGGILGGETTNNVVGPDDFSNTSVGSQQNAITDQYAWNKGVMAQLSGIIGLNAWRADPQGGTTAGVGARSLTQLNNDKLGRSLEQTITGTTWTWEPDVSTDSTQMIWNNNGSNSWVLTHAPSSGDVTWDNEGSSVIRTDGFSVAPTTPALQTVSVLRSGDAVGSVVGFRSGSNYAAVPSSANALIETSSDIVLTSNVLAVEATNGMQIGADSTARILNIYRVTGTVTISTAATNHSSDTYDLSSGTFSVPLPGGTSLTSGNAAILSWNIPPVANPDVAATNGERIFVTNVNMIASPANTVEIYWNSNVNGIGSTTASVTLIVAEMGFGNYVPASTAATKTQIDNA